MDTIIFVVVLLLFFLLLLFLTFLNQKKSREEENNWRQPENFPNSEEEQAEQKAIENERREQASRQQREREDKVSAVAKADITLAQELQKTAGLGHLPLIQSTADRELIQQIAQRIRPDLLEMMHVAATQTDVDFNLTKEVKREPVVYPTRDIEPTQMTSYEQIPDILPEEQLLSDDEYYQGIAEQSHRVLQPYETISRRKRLYALEDVSSSMDERMSNGIPRYIWAHGISINLGLRALKGEADFCRREFDGAPHSLIQVHTSQEAQQLIERVLSSRTTPGGTNILNALNQAVRDIRSQQSMELGTDILLISDGEDNSINNTAALKALLGEDIRLHVAMIGAESSSLKEVATTYRVFN